MCPKAMVKICGERQAQRLGGKDDSKLTNNNNLDNPLNDPEYMDFGPYEIQQ